jgi:mRNA interferase RelE/StbE
MTGKPDVRYTKTFWRAFKNLTKIEQRLVKDKIKILKDNPYRNSLRSKKVRGNPGVFEFSVNMDIRVLWRYENGQIILMLNVGHHDILRNFR